MEFNLRSKKSNSVYLFNMNNPANLEKETEEDKNEDESDDDDRGVNHLRLALLPHHEGAGHQEVGFVCGIHVTIKMISLIIQVQKILQLIILGLLQQHVILLFVYILQNRFKTG